MRLIIGLCSPQGIISIVEAYTFNFKVYFLGLFSEECVDTVSNSITLFLEVTLPSL